VNDQPTPRLRLSVLGAVTVVLFGALFVRLYNLQVVGSPEYQVQAEANRVREVYVPAPRGRILDRNGKVMVDNTISVVVAIERNEFSDLPDDEADEVLARLALELNQVGTPVTVEEMRERIFDQRFSRYAPVPVAQDVPEELKIYLEERADEFPSVSVERTAVRRYPYGPLAAHVMGYVGKINETELEAVADARVKPYTLNDEIGKAGVEKAYEAHLRGTPGLRLLEVDAEGDPVRVIDESLPVPGSDVVLSLDIDLQALAQQKLEQGLQAARERGDRGGPANVGAAVVEDPNNGQILAMATYPTYDPTAFVDGIDGQEWAWLNDPANHYPLYNWAIQGQWASGSTFKLFTAYSALHSGLMAPDTVFYDRGGYLIPTCRSDVDPRCYRSNAGGASYGAITMPRAITVSSDAYFYNVGAQFWLQRERLGGEQGMQNYISPFGIGAPTGIPLSDEKAGRLPTPEWFRNYTEQVGRPEDWSAGHSVNLAIGQGDVLLTPLQLANGYATFANGGTRFEPQVALRIEPPGEVEAPIQVEPVVGGEVDLPPHVREPILEGLVGVTRNGTASRAFAGFDHESWPVAGKTGTAQVDNKADTAVFAAFGPAPAPEYAIAVFMEESGFGGTAAAPVVRSLLDALSGAAPMPPAPPGGDLTVPTDDLVDPGGSYD
jgi:penicillin-binding protein 2